VAVWIALSAGCYLSHARPGGTPDAASVEDAGVPFDAGPEAGPIEDAGPPPDAAPVVTETGTPIVEWEVAVATSARSLSVAEAEVTVTGDGSAVVAWITDDGALAESRIDVATLDADGNVSRRRGEIYGGRLVDFDPAACTTPGNVVVLVAGCYDYDRYDYYSGGPTDGHLCATRSIDGGRTFDDWTEIDPPLEPIPEGRLYDRPWIACASDGTVWMTVSRIDGDVFYSYDPVPQVILLTASEDEGESWHEPVEVGGVEMVGEWTPGVGASSRSDVVIGLSDLEEERIYTTRADGSSWPPTIGTPVLTVDGDSFPVFATTPSGATEMAGWRGVLAAAPDRGGAFVADGFLGDLVPTAGVDVACGDLARREDCLWAAWLQGSWSALEWSVLVSRRCGADPFPAPLVRPDAPFSGTPHVYYGGTWDVWFGHFIGVSTAPDGTARVAWVDTRDGANTVWVAKLR